jgi:hypothetical protein
MPKNQIPWLLALVLILGCGRAAEDSDGDSSNIAGIEASGTFSPTGPPSEPPTRVDAGRRCIVDVEQAYSIAGTLSGSVSVNYRILVEGPCGSPIGTFDESWIAYGAFRGSLDGAEVSSPFSYVAKVKAGGEVSGHIVFGSHLNGELRVTGNFSDGRLSYAGRLERN